MFLKAPSKLGLLLLSWDPWERWIGGGGSGGEQAGDGLHCEGPWGRPGSGGHCYMRLASPGWGLQLPLHRLKQAFLLGTISCWPRAW